MAKNEKKNDRKRTKNDRKLRKMTENTKNDRKIRKMDKNIMTKY